VRFAALRYLQRGWCQRGAAVNSTRPGDTYISPLVLSVAAGQTRLPSPSSAATYPTPEWHTGVRDYIHVADPGAGRIFWPWKRWIQGRPKPTIWAMGQGFSNKEVIAAAAQCNRPMRSRTVSAHAVAGRSGGGWWRQSAEDSGGAGLGSRATLAWRT